MFDRGLFERFSRSRPGPRIERLRDVARAPALAKLHATAFAQPWDAAAFEGLILERGTVLNALFAGDALNGFALSRAVLGEAEVLSVVVAAACRRGGQGGRLLGAHLGALSAEGVRRVHLEVEEGNAPALALYTRFGFQAVGRREGYYRRPDGSRVAAVTMSLPLG